MNMRVASSGLQGVHLGGLGYLRDAVPMNALREETYTHLYRVIIQTPVNRPKYSSACSFTTQTL